MTKHRSTQSTTRQQEQQGARGGAPGRFFRSALLGWDDPESGDRLAVNIQASPAFLHDLRGLGFSALGSRRLGGPELPRLRARMQAGATEPNPVESLQERTEGALKPLRA